MHRLRICIPYLAPQGDTPQMEIADPMIARSSSRTSRRGCMGGNAAVLPQDVFNHGAITRPVEAGIGKPHRRHHSSSIATGCYTFGSA
ncbi:hypothetical protein HBH56_145910 [Parastagonospora nodorum]|nr:hypothetical protein HBH56_145910 [Parastagonospora nodorum]KAH3927730.1 hypothetical protein HBH54_151100 [Parastagonospora nodorum]KAH3947932.1 hypothetical protein HBH53_111120 [Parastagonospora nodorum]KAH4020619.1 hypothetical protein HBI13_117330 [Parastagonospora nodorum]KAH4065433.1 hypothetical protein HBH50_166380 [Parastagonospora nodorum]